MHESKKKKKNQSLREGAALAGVDSFRHSEHIEGTRCAIISSHGGPSLGVVEQGFQRGGGMRCGSTLGVEWGKSTGPGVRRSKFLPWLCRCVTLGESCHHLHGLQFSCLFSMGSRPHSASQTLGPLRVIWGWCLLKMKISRAPGWLCQ